MSDLLEVTEESFESEVLQAGKPVLVDFGATWCAPCKHLDPIVEELAGEWGAAVKVVKLDVDNNPGVAMNFQVWGLPTLMLFNGGEIKERLTGFQPKAKIVDKFAPHL